MQDTFQVQFVINDDVSGMVDNNKNRDFELPLLNPPTEDQVHESRAEKMKAWERRIRKVLLLLPAVPCDQPLPSAACVNPKEGQMPENRGMERLKRICRIPPPAACASASDIEEHMCRSKEDRITTAWLQHEALFKHTCMEFMLPDLSLAKPMLNGS